MAYEVKSMRGLKSLVENNPEAMAAFEEDPKKFINEVKDPRMDIGIFKTVLYIVGFVLLISMIVGVFIIYLSYRGEPPYEIVKVPEFIVAMASTSLGALVGLLAPQISSEN